MKTGSSLVSKLWLTNGLKMMSKNTLEIKITKARDGDYPRQILRGTLTGRTYDRLIDFMLLDSLFKIPRHVDQD